MSTQLKCSIATQSPLTKCEHLTDINLCSLANKLSCCYQEKLTGSPEVQKSDDVTLQVLQSNFDALPVLIDFIKEMSNDDNNIVRDKARKTLVTWDKNL